VLVLLGAAVAGLPLPLLPIQILWLNMVTDTFPALALGVEPGDPDVMTRPPRDPQEELLSRRFLGTVLFYGLLITGCTLAAYVWALHREAAHATTVSFMTLALAQIFHLGNARSAAHVLHPVRAASNRHAVGAVVVSIGLQLMAVYVGPLARVLRLEPLDSVEWAVILALVALPAVIGQVLKMSRAHRLVAWT